MNKDMEQTLTIGPALVSMFLLGLAFGLVFSQVGFVETNRAWFAGGFIFFGIALFAVSAYFGLKDT